MTDADYLAGLMKECPGCLNESSSDFLHRTGKHGGRDLHPDCHYSGQVPVFPTLRRVCGHLGLSSDEWRMANRCDWSFLPLAVAREKHQDCPSCNGLGYAPVVDMETALVAAWGHALTPHPTLGEITIIIALWESLDTQANPTEAVYAAIRQVMEAKHE